MKEGERGLEEIGRTRDTLTFTSLPVSSEVVAVVTAAVEGVVSVIAVLLTAVTLTGTFVHTRLRVVWRRRERERGRWKERKRGRERERGGERKRKEER